MRVRRKKVPKGFQEVKEPVVVPVKQLSPPPENVLKSRLFRKICAECGHNWSKHFRGSCIATGEVRSTRCLCNGFIKKLGDIL